MVVGATLKVETQALKDLEVFIGDIAEMSFGIAQDVFRRIEPPFRNELQFYPPKPPKSRYVRTFRLKRGWQIQLDRPSSTLFRLVVSNATPYTQWVVGSLAQNGERFQTQVHKRNGWFQANKTTTFWFQAFNDDFAKAFTNELGAFAKTNARKRAFTRL